MENDSDSAYRIDVKLTNLRLRADKLQVLLGEWDQRFGCSFSEKSGKVVFHLGRTEEQQLWLEGKRSRKYVYVNTVRIQAVKRHESSLLEVIEWLMQVQTSDFDFMGLLIYKEGQQAHPLVIYNGEIYDKGRMLDILWGHYAATKVRESRKIQDVYHFLRDVPTG